MSEQISFSLEEISHLNESLVNIYEALNTAASLQPFAKEVLSNIREVMYFDKGNFIVINTNGDESYEVESFLSLGWSKSDVDIYIEKYFGVDDVIPMLTKNNPIAFRNNDFFEVTERKKTAYYKEFVESSKIETSIDANILLNGISDKKMIMGFFRDPGKKGFSRKDIEIVKVFQPHLSNIFSNYFKKVPAVSEKPQLDILESFDTLGICMLDSSLNPISYNYAYSRFANENVLGGHLTETVKHYCRSLFGSDESSSIVDSTTETLPGLDDADIEAVNENFIIEVTKHPTASGERFLALVYSVSDIFLFRFKDLAKRYNLTSREYEVLLLTIGKGFSVEEIASTLFISTSTIKKHISSAYQKMDINSQKQLISLLRFL